MGKKKTQKGFSVLYLLLAKQILALRSSIRSSNLYKINHKS